MSIKQLILAAGVLAASAATAVDDTFPNKDGSGNLLSTDAWGGPVSQNRMKIGAGGTYYADPNGTINGIVIGTTGKVIFDQTKSTQENPLVTMGAGFDIGGTGRDVTFKGGTYDFQEAYGFARGAYGAYTGNTILFDGCVFTNLTGDLSATYNGSTLSTWTLANGAVIHTKGALKPDYFGNGAARVYIADGSRLVAEGVMHLGRRNNGDRGSVDQKVIVDGAGSYLRFGSSGAGSFVGASLSSALLEARNGAQIKAVGTLSIGAGTSDSPIYTTNNVVRATGVGTTVSMGTVHFGECSNSGTNLLEVLDGAQASSSWVSFYGDGNGILCSNGVVDVTQFEQQSGTGHHYIRVQGDHPQVAMTEAGGSYKQVNFCNGFRLIYDLPPDGYRYESATAVPIASWHDKDAPKMVVDETTVIEFNGVDEYCAGLKKRGLKSERFKIAFFGCNGYDGNLNAELLEAWNARLPDNLVLDSPGRGASTADGIARSLYVTITAPIEVAAIGEVTYEKLEDAIAAAKDGETVKLLESVAVAKTLTLDGGDTAEVKKAVTLDLNGLTIEASKATDYGLIVKGVDLTVTGDPAGAQGLFFRRLRVEGAGTKFRFGRSASSQIGGYTGDQVNRLIEAADGAKVYIGYSELTLGGNSSSHGNVVRAIGEGSLVQFPNTTSLGWNGSYANLVEAIDGGTANLSYYNFEGKESGLVCSNGCLSIVQYSRMGNDNFARVSGDHPELVLSTEGSSQGHKLSNRFKLTVDLPATGYDYDERTVIPVYGTSNNSSSDGTMTIELTGMTDYVMHFVNQKIWRHTMRLVSLKNAKFTQAMVDAWNVPLADTGVTLKLVDSENIDLVYKVPREYAPGMMLILR